MLIYFDTFVSTVGLLCIVLCWIPQTMETLKVRRCTVNRSFLILTFVGAVSLTLHSVFISDVPFMILNFCAAVGSSINLYFSIYPSEHPN
ncbi:MAG: hypothetical protein IAF08_07035 [Rhizobacter sp.]|nr:hypothetical protein [Chlorobiales bacterium]